MSAEPLLAEPGETLVEAVMAVIRQRIATRSLAPGARAPSLRRLAETLAVSKSTVVEAYDRAGPELVVLGDPSLFERVLDALIQHGIERTRRGCVAIEMWWSQLDGEDGVIEVEFEDTARDTVRGPRAGEPIDRIDTPRAIHLANTAHELTERLGGWLERRERSGRVSWRLTVEFPLPEPRRLAG